MTAEPQDYPYYWTREDVRTCEALMDGGFLSDREPVSVLSIVNAARAFERARVIDLLQEVSHPLPDIVHPVIRWLNDGAPPADIWRTYGT